jgi:hypothetical protein
MSAIVYNSPKITDLEVPVIRVKDGHSRFTRNVSMCLSHYTVSHPTEEQFSYLLPQEPLKPHEFSLLWKLQISYKGEFSQVSV